MPGLRELIEKQMRPHCPHCHKPLDLTEFSSELFQLVLRTIEQGERVLVAHFGSFYAKYVAGRKINHFRGSTQIAGRKVIRFRATANAKRLINERFRPEAQDDRRPIAVVRTDTDREDVGPEPEELGGTEDPRGSDEEAGAASAATVEVQPVDLPGAGEPVVARQRRARRCRTR